MRFGGKSKKGPAAVVVNEQQENVQLTTATSNGSSGSGSSSPSSLNTTKATDTKVTNKNKSPAHTPRITTTTQTFRANGSEVHHLAEISDVESIASAGGADNSADDLSSTKHLTADAEVVSDVEGETGAVTDMDTDADIRSTSSSDESSIYSTEDEDDDDDIDNTATSKADNCDKYANAESSDDEEDESKAESLEVTSEQYHRSSMDTEGAEDGVNAAPEKPTEESTIEKDEHKKKVNDKDDVSLTVKPSKLSDKLNASNHLNGDSTESTIATQDDETASQASETSECEDPASETTPPLEPTPWVKIKSEADTVAPVVTESIAPVETEAVAPVVTESIVPVESKTVAPVATETVAPVESKTVAPVVTEPVAPVESKTLAPVVTETVASVETKTVTPVETEKQADEESEIPKSVAATVAAETPRSVAATAAAGVLARNQLAVTAAADVAARKELLQQYRDQAASKTIPQLIRQDLMGKSAHTIQIRAALDELAARASPVKHDLDDEYADHKARVDQVNKHRATIARTGGLLAIVQTMERFTDNADIQVSACRGLEKLALDGENETAIADVGGVEAILAAMMANFTNASVHEATWGALMNLSCRNADSVMTVDTAGGMEAIIAAMQHHVDNPLIQRNACGTLANLCVSNDMRRAALAKAGGFVAISAALQRHWNDPDVKDEASSALTALLEEPARHYDAKLERSRS